MGLFTCRDDVPEAYKLIDPAWMFHCPVRIGLAFLEAIPETRKEGEAYFFKEPFDTNIFDFTSLFDGMVIYEKLENGKTLVHCFTVDPTPEGRKAWRKLTNEYKAKGESFLCMVAHYM